MTHSTSFKPPRSHPPTHPPKTVDNNPISFIAQPSNGVPVSSFYDDPKDNALPVVNDLIDEHLAHAEDVRPVLHGLFGKPLNPPTHPPTHLLPLVNDLIDEHLAQAEDVRPVLHRLFGKPPTHPPTHPPSSSPE